MIFLKKSKIAYVPVPKIACSSLKHLFFVLENGRRFEKFRANGKPYTVHSVLRTRNFEEGYRLDQFKDFFKFVVVRDPIKRFLSAYSNRVLHYKMLHPWALGHEAIENGVKKAPTLSEFVDDLELYRKWSNDIRHHTDPIVTFAGRDFSVYDQIYRIENLDDCRKKISEIVGQDVEILHEQTGGRKFSIDDLTPDQIEKLERFYDADYALLEQWYRRPSAV